MRAKTIIGVALAVMLILAALPQAWAVVEYNSYKLQTKLCEKYNIPKNEYGTYNVRDLAEKLESKPERELTVEEAQFLLEWYSVKAGQSGSDELFQQNLKKAEHYFNLIMQKDSDYVPAYLALMKTYGIEGSSRNIPELEKRALELELKTLELNPDGRIIDDGGEENTWTYLSYDLESFKYSYGYSIPDDLIKWFREVGTMAQHDEIKTKEDLERIGFYEKRDEVLKALEEKPLLQKVMDAIPVGTTQTKGLAAELLRIHRNIAIAAGAIFAFLVFLGALWLRQRRAAAA